MRPENSHTAEQRLRLLQDIAARLRAEMSLRQILGGIACSLRERFDWDYVGCASVDPVAGRIRYEAHATREPSSFPLGQTQPLGAGIMGEVASTARPLCVDDVERHSNYVPAVPGSRSELCVPVLHQGEVIAVLDAQSRRPAAFADDDRHTLGLVAELLGGSLAASRQLEAARHRAEVIALLADVSRAALAEDGLDAMLQRLIDELQRCFQLSLATLCLRDEPTAPLHLRAFAGRSRYPLQRGAEWRQQQGVTGRAMRTGKRVFVPDVRLDPDYLQGNPDTRSELVLPIRFREQVLGFINLESAQPGIFSPANQLAVQALADQVAGAIHLALTMQRLEETRRAEAAIAVALERSHRRLERANRRLRVMSLRDPLTGLGNRRQLDRSLKQLWREALRTQAPLGLLLIDIDHYKAFNDHYGHGEGDVCLQRVGLTLRRLTRRRGTLALRYGGEEFALLLPACDEAMALAVADRLHRRIAALGIAHAASPTATQLTVSIGVACRIPQPNQAVEDLLAAADLALYAAKRDGRQRTCLG